MKHKLQKRRVAKRQMLLFVLMFALLGTYLILRSLAATPPPVSQVHTASTAASPMSSFPDTTDGIHLGIAFDYWLTNPKLIQGKVDYIWGSSNPTANTAHHDAYVPFDVDPIVHDGSTTHDLAYWQQTDPSWIVYQCDQKTPAYYDYNTPSQDPNIPLDFSNTAVVSYQLQTIQKLKLLAPGSSYDGISWDDFQFTNFEARCGTCKIAPPAGQACPAPDWNSLGYPPKGDASPKLTADMTTWLERLSTQFRQQFPDKTITVNSAPALSGLTAQPNASQYLQYIDMDFDEYGFTKDKAGRLSDIQWRQEVKGVNLLNAAGRAIDINAYVPNQPLGSAGQHDETNWVLANYLLVKGPHTYTYLQGYAGQPGCVGRCLVDLPEYHVPIGSPTSLAPMPSASTTVYKRTYTGGEVLVNPSSTNSYPVSLGATYQDMYGNKLSSVTLAPATGIVLLNVPASSPPTGPTGGSGSPAPKTGSSSGGSASASSSSSGATNNPATGRSATTNSTKRSHDPVIATIQAVGAKPVYYVSALSGLLVAIALAVYWVHHLHRLGRPLPIHLTQTRAEPSRPDPQVDTSLAHIHSANTPAPGTVINPQKDPHET